MDAAERRRLLAEGARAFNAGRFYDAHELWETLWNALDGAERVWIQGLIQIATALHKLERDRADLCLTLLDKGIAKLGDARIVGWDVAQLRNDALRLARAIAAGEPRAPLRLRPA